MPFRFTFFCKIGIWHEFLPLIPLGKPRVHHSMLSFLWVKIWKFLMFSYVHSLNFNFVECFGFWTHLLFPHFFPMFYIALEKGDQNGKNKFKKKSIDASFIHTHIDPPFIFVQPYMLLLLIIKINFQCSQLMH